jgi:hypothetical protein
MSRPSRRGVLGGFAALTAPSIPALAAKGVHNQHTPAMPASGVRIVSGPSADAAPLEACAAYMKAEHAWHAGHARLCDAEEIGDVEEVRRMEALCQAAAREQDEPLTLIIETPARTAAGRRAKAEAVRTRVQLNTEGAPMDPDEALLWSMCDDLAAAGTGS